MHQQTRRRQEQKKNRQKEEKTWSRSLSMSESSIRYTWKWMPNKIHFHGVIENATVWPHSKLLRKHNEHSGRWKQRSRLGRRRRSLKLNFITALNHHHFTIYNVLAAVLLSSSVSLSLSWQFLLPSSSASPLQCASCHAHTQSHIEFQTHYVRCFCFHCRLLSFTSATKSTITQQRSSDCVRTNKRRGRNG